MENKLIIKEGKIYLEGFSDIANKMNIILLPNKIAIENSELSKTDNHYSVEVKDKTIIDKNLYAILKGRGYDEIRFVKNPSGYTQI